MKRKRKEIIELREFLNVTGYKHDKKMVSIVFDGKQYSVRIPRRFIDSVEINPKLDSFMFSLLLPPANSSKEPKLMGKFVRGQNG